MIHPGSRFTIRQTLIGLTYIASIFLLLSPISSSASATNNHQVTRITAALYEAPPWGWKAPNGQLKGVGPELIRKLVNAVDPSIEVNIILGATERIIQLTLSNQADILITFYDERLAEKATHLAEGISYDYQAWSLAKTPLKTLSDLQSLRLATSQSYKDVIEVNAKSVNYVSSSKNLIPILLSGHVDVVAALAHGLEFNAEKHGYSKKDFSILTIKSFDTHVWISKQSKINNELQRWKNAHAKVLTLESYNQIIQKLLMQEASPSKSTAHSGG